MTRKASFLPDGTTLTVTLEETITIDDRDYGGKQTVVLEDIYSVDRRLVSIPTSEVEIVKMGTAVAAGQYVESKVKYIRFTNLDDTNHISLTFKDEGNAEYGIKLDKGQSYIYNGDISGGVVDTMTAHTSGITPGTFYDLVHVTALADCASCDLEVYVAMVA